MRKFEASFNSQGLYTGPVTDIHSHYGEEDHLRYEKTRFLEELLNILEENNVICICLSVIYREGGNEELHEIIKDHHERVTGFGFVRLGIDDPEVIEQLYRRGFDGTKIMWPPGAYNDPSNHPYFDKIQKLRMSVLLHTGRVRQVLSWSKQDEKKSPERMRARFLGDIARKLPDLVIIGAHLGRPDYEGSAKITEIHPNVYFDISDGEDILGAAVKLLSEGKINPEKLLFGSDTLTLSENGDRYAQTKEFFTNHGIEKGFQYMIFYGNAARILVYLMMNLFTQTTVIQS